MDLRSVSTTIGTWNRRPWSRRPTAPSTSRCRPTFQWIAARGGHVYSLEVDDRPRLRHRGLTQTTHHRYQRHARHDLASNTQYYWRVTAANPAATGSHSAVFSFYTEALPGDCGIGTTAVR